MDTPHPTSHQPRSVRLPAAVRQAAIGLAAAFFALTPFGAAGLQSADAAEMELTPLGQIGGAALAVAVQGDRVYSGIGPRLVIADLSDPAAPRVLGQSDVLPGLVLDIAVGGSVAYVASEAGLAVFDVADPARPALIATRYPDIRVPAVALAGSRLVVPTTFGFYVLDVEDPRDPRDLWTTGLPYNPTDVAVAGDHAFVTMEHWGTGVGTLLAFDIGGPDSFGLVGSMETPSDALLCVATDGRHAYVGADEKGFLIFDVSQPAAIRELGRAEFSGESVAIAAADGYAYVAVNRYDDVGDDGLRIIDVRDPEAPRQAGYLWTEGTPAKVALAAGHAFLAAGGEGLRVIDARDPAQPRAVGGLGASDYGVGIAVDGRYAYVPARTSHFAGDRLAVIDLEATDDPSGAGPALPRELGSVPLRDVDHASSAIELTATRGYVYVSTVNLHHGGGDSVQVIDARDPAHPVVAAVLPMRVGALAAEGGYLFVLDPSLKVFDLRQPTAPELVASLDTVVGGALALDGGYAYVADGDMKVIDMRDPTRPRVVGALGNDRLVHAIDVAGSLAYLLRDGETGGRELVIAEVGDPTSPRMASIYAHFVKLQSVFAVEQAAVVAHRYGLALVDARDPRSPNLPVAWFLYPPMQAINGLGRRVWSLAEHGGLYAFDLQIPAPEPTASSTPVPTTAATPTATPGPRWAPAGALLQPHIGHSATLLQDGTVLVAGGTTGAAYGVPLGQLTASGSEIYDPAGGRSRAIDAMSVDRMDHAAVLLADGSVLVAGGLTFFPPGTARLSVTRSAERYDPVAPVPGRWRSAGAMQVARTGHTLTRLADGRVLAVGGHGDVNPFRDPYHASAEIYDPVAGTWSPTGSMASVRAGHAATRLRDGTVLVTGGATKPREALATAERYDPATGTWTAAGRLQAARIDHSATLLADGRVLIVGGGELTVGGGRDLNAPATAEIFDPATNSSVAAETLGAWRDKHSATLLPDGRVLVAGGLVVDHGATSAVALYDPATGHWTQGPELLKGRGGHTATMLPGGRVLVAGGGGYLAPEVRLPAFATVELLQVLPADSQPIEGPPAVRDAHRALLLTDGRVLVAGGFGADRRAVADALLFDPASGTWQPTGGLNTARGDFSATLLPNGEVLVAGGQDPQAGAALASAELYNPAAGTWRPSGAMTAARSGHAATLLGDGRVLVVGYGRSWFNGQGAWGELAAELYDPARGTWQALRVPPAIRALGLSATLLEDGRVLVVSQGAADLFDPATGIWRGVAAPRGGYARHTASLMPDGSVLIAGGEEIVVHEGAPSTGAPERFDPRTERWSRAGEHAGHYSKAAVLLPGGELALAGGAKYESVMAPGIEGLYKSALNRLDLYDPAANAWRSIHLHANREAPSATLLPDGRVLFLSGTGRGTAGTMAAEIFDPRPPRSMDDPRPVISSLNGAIAAGERLAIAGTGFAGRSAASGGNGVQDSPTNHPLVQLRSLASGQTRHLSPDPAAGWSDTAFTSAPITGFAPGPALVTLFSSGIQSDGRITTILPCARGSTCAMPIPTARTIYLPFAVAPQATAAQARRLTRSPRREWQPAVSPNGRWLAYISEDVAVEPETLGAVELRVLDLASGIDRALSIDGLLAAETPSFTSDSRRIVFAGRRNPPGESPLRFTDWEILVADLDGSAGPFAKHMPTDERRPGLAGDGTVCYDSERDGNTDIFCQDAARQVETRITDHPGIDKHAAPSPGQPIGELSLLYRSERDGDSELYHLITSLEGRLERRVTHAPGFDGFPSMSRSGSAVFESRRGGREGVYEIDHIWEDDQAPGNLRTIATGAADFVTPRYSPDGCWVALASNAGGKRDDPSDLDVYLWPRGGCAP